MNKPNEERLTRSIGRPRVTLAKAEAGVYTGELSYGLVVHTSVRFERNPLPKLESK